MKPTSLSELWQETNKILLDIESWLQSYDKKRVPLRFKPIDQARLLKLRVWSVKYEVSVKEILTIIVPILRNLTPKQRRGYGVGVSMNMLTGRKAEDILHDVLRIKYPDGENRIMWREVERDRQIAREQLEDQELTPKAKSEYTSPLQAGSIELFAQAYKDKIESRRREYSVQYNQSWRKRKPYRGNPWR